MEKGAVPVLIARRAVAAAGLEEQIEVRAGDGLAALKAGEARVIVIAGMGGETIASILENNTAVAKAADLLVIQPMTRVACARRWLVDHGWRIEREALVAEKKRLYQVIAAAPGKGRDLNWLEEEMGPLLLAQGHPLLHELAGLLAARYEKELAGISRSKANELDGRRKELAGRIAQLKTLLQRLEGRCKIP